MPPPRRGGHAKVAVLWAAAAVYALVIFYLSSLPNPLPALVTRVSDKILHAVEYGGLAALVSLGLRASGLRPERALLLTVVAATLYAASDELHQAFVPGRDCSVGDWAADMVGATASALVVFSLGRRRMDAHGRPS